LVFQVQHVLDGTYILVPDFAAAHG